MAGAGRFVRGNRRSGRSTGVPAEQSATTGRSRTDRSGGRACADRHQHRQSGRIVRHWFRRGRWWPTRGNPCGEGTFHPSHHRAQHSVSATVNLPRIAFDTGDVVDTDINRAAVDDLLRATDHVRVRSAQHEQYTGSLSRRLAMIYWTAGGIDLGKWGNKRSLA
jgi:hypothetical protein